MNSFNKISFRPAVAALLLCGTAAAAATGGMALTASDPAPVGRLAEPQAASVARAGVHASLADMVAAVGTSVVQIQVKPENQAMRLSGPSDPRSQQEEMLRRFFGNPEPRQEAPRGALGSGFIIDASGIVVTNAHVVQGADTVTVQLSDGRELPGQVLGRDEKTDLAVIRIEGTGGFQAVPWGDSDATRVGDSVFAVGSPFGLGNTVTAGIVSARSREIGAGPYDDFLQVDAAINSGNSGGPLFDANGRVVGVNTAIFSPSGGNVGIGFAIPAQLARTVATQIVEHGSIERGRIGVALQDFTSELAEEQGVEQGGGALIAQVEQGGPAALSGIQPGDVVQRFAGKTIKDGGDLARAVADASSGSRVPVQVLRDRRHYALNLRIGSDAAARS